MCWVDVRYGGHNSSSSPITVCRKGWSLQAWRRSTGSLGGEGLCVVYPTRLANLIQLSLSSSALSFYSVQLSLYVLQGAHVRVCYVHAVRVRSTRSLVSVSLFSDRRSPRLTNILRAIAVRVCGRSTHEKHVHRCCV